MKNKKIEDWLVKLNDKVRGSLIGGAAGDALGFMVEFRNEEEIFEKYGPHGISEYDLVDGEAQISDDTQMTLFTATGLLAAFTDEQRMFVGNQLNYYIYLSYLDWLHTQKPEEHPEHPSVSWLVDEPRMYERRAPGNTCLTALASGDMGAWEWRINRSKGCGGVMRVAPVGLLMGISSDYCEDVDLLGAQAAAITHGHDLGFIPGAMLVDLTGRLSRSDMSIREATDLAMEAMRKLFSGMEHIDAFLELMQKAIDLSEVDMTDLESIHELGEGWVGEEAMAIALYCALKYPEDIESALIAAVNHGGDSDSTGAITGNIVGAHVGMSRIPDKFLEHLELKDVILEVADDLSIGYYGGSSGARKGKAWKKKYRVPEGSR